MGRQAAAMCTAPHSINQQSAAQDRTAQRSAALSTCVSGSMSSASQMCSFSSSPVAPPCTRCVQFCRRNLQGGSKGASS